ncbi:ABC-F family ATP-binding cassette domain-containing protein [Microbispora sp. SCL1-1]|uniref:ATP-binding cassette domain-containing protein n=1 Tax=unclassified Microbispora TaxID=2614687 RepID=UPI00115BD8A0|nr:MULTISPECIES: ATP-binding cassette domain-containing protein [unclassified Microbispora]NJP23702.1 ABC-F family ATP-binding cassette domain-containing protein [Microbispora sp. CL1-1]TQS15913.1 ABC-F family ATP-binding cassette domain-containing protein [Microbispora sp. SCL1-1]
MITLRGVDVRVGARLLLSGVTAHVAPGDRVGRNGAGKTTLLKTLAGELQPAAGTITRTGEVGYLPQDPAAADPSLSVTARILSARGLDEAERALRAAEAAMRDPAQQERAMRRYVRAEAEFEARGGYAAQAEAARIAAGLGLPDRVMTQPVGTLPGGQRRRVELARILFAGQGTLLLDEPTNHLDADSVAWLRSFLASRTGGLVLISHDTTLLDDTVNRIWRLDADRAALEVHNTGRRTYLADRDAIERGRARQRAVVENLAAAAPHLGDGEVRRILGSFLFGGDDAGKPAGVLSGGEKTRLALATLVSSQANVLLLDEPTNNLDPASRDEVLAAVASYQGAVVMVTHADKAVEALRPDRVLLLPDGVEDMWNSDYAGLVSLA